MIQTTETTESTYLSNLIAREKGSEREEKGKGIRLGNPVDSVDPVVTT